MVYPALLPLMHTPRLPIVDWTDAPADLHGLARFAERRNLVSGRVPSHFNWPLPHIIPYRIWSGIGASSAQTLSSDWAELYSNLPRTNDCVPMIVGPYLTGCISCMEVDFSCRAHSINSIYTHHICAIYREILCIQNHPQFCYPLITPLLLFRASLRICLAVHCSSSWNVLHEHRAANFYWALDWHCSDQGHYCACGTRVTYLLEMTTAIFIGLFCLPGSTNGSIHPATKRRRYISSLLMWEPSVRIIRTLLVIVTSIRPHTLTQTFVWVQGSVCHIVYLLEFQM